MQIPNSVLIVGAGPAGLITYRNLAIFGQFSTVQLYERRDDVGGVWYLDNPPQDSITPRWPSPAYPGLIGNVLPEFLSFSHFPFPHRTDLNQPFPTLTETHEFLRVFAEPYVQKGKMKLNMEVIRVEELSQNKGWRVLTKDWNKGGEVEETFWDSVVIAVGWYDHPVWPDTPGLDLLREKGLAKHAVDYRGPQGNQDKRALVIGNANSSNDIASHLAPIAKSPIYQSIRRPAFPGFPSLPDERIQMVPPVLKYQLDVGPDSPTEETIIAHLADGNVLRDIDVVYIGTGYRPCPDFVHVLDPENRRRRRMTRRRRIATTTVGDDDDDDGNDDGNGDDDDGDDADDNAASDDADEDELIPLISQNPHPSAGYRIPSLHRHILYAHNPSLAFIGSTMSFTPFTISDVSSLWLTYVWKKEISYPSTSTTTSLLEFEQQRLQVIDEWREKDENPSALYVYSVLGMTEEEFASGLKRDVVDVRPEFEIHLPEWNQERKVYREGMYQRKFEALMYARENGLEWTTTTGSVVSNEEEV